MKVFKLIPNFLGVLIAILVFASCEEEFNNLETDIIEQNFVTDVDSSRTVVAYSKPIVGVQTNGLTTYQIGTYRDPFYGKSTANIVTQLGIAPIDTDPDFGNCTVLDSVIMYLPYFSTEDANTDEFELDSIFGNQPINIKIFESNFFLQQNDPNSNFEEPQSYFSNQTGDIENNLLEEIFEINNFRPQSNSIVLNDTVTLPPGLRIALPGEFFRDKILTRQGTPELLNNNNFREYFRGLYFKVTGQTGNGNLTFFNFQNEDNPPNITLHYTFTEEVDNYGDCSNPETERFQGTFQMLFNGINVNLFENESTIGTSINDLFNVNTRQGEETLFMKGGNGFVTVVELFGDRDLKKTLEVNDNLILVDGSNGVPDELDELRVNNWLINEANLIFYVDQDKVQGGSTEPERIIIFDTKNNTVLVDYNFDITSGNSPIDAIGEHLGRLERGSDDNGDFYKIRITNHLTNLITRDSTNIPLGVMVSQNVTQIGFQELTSNAAGEFLDAVPGTSVIAPEGTVLHGNLSPDLNKRLKLRIFYTNPE